MWSRTVRISGQRDQISRATEAPIIHRPAWMCVWIGEPQGL